ncbi:alpha/beta fold hydrolase [Acidithrix ferrooxidans]|nr:alpha/beta fold hydrolase [Acidithrix ferrooxidans]
MNHLTTFRGSTLRCTYIDEGDSDAPVVLLMHGEPSWSCLFRKMIPPLLKAEFRCVAPDLIGFGRSDKPTLTTDYTFGRHVNWMHELIIKNCR